MLDCAIPLASRFRAIWSVSMPKTPVPYTSATGFPDTEFLQVSADMNRERAEKLQAIFSSISRIPGFPSVAKPGELFG